MGHELSTPNIPPGCNRANCQVWTELFGIKLGTDTRNLFENHYKAESMHTGYCGHQIMMIEDLTGRLLPKEPIQLYMAPINFHLIHGCEISPDSEDMHLKQPCKVQLLCIHRSNAQSLHWSLIALILGHWLDLGCIEAAIPLPMINSDTSNNWQRRWRLLKSGACWNGYKVKLIRLISFIGYTDIVNSNRTRTGNLFENHYKAESTHTCYCGHWIMTIEDLTGRLLPKEPM
jgi:hypothetical protein